MPVTYAHFLQWARQQCGVLSLSAGTCSLLQTAVAAAGQGTELELENERPAV